MSTELTTNEELEKYQASLQKKWSGGESTPINEIKISYDEDNHRGEYVANGEKGPQVLGKSFTGKILCVRHQYTQYNDEREKRAMTSEFEDWSDQVSLFLGGQHVMTDEYREVKKYFKGLQDDENPENDIQPAPGYEDMKYNENLYVLFEGVVYRLIVKPAGRENFWEFRKNNQNKLPYAFDTEFGIDEGKKGTTKFFFNTFKEGAPTPSEDMEAVGFKSYETDKWLNEFNEKRLERALGESNSDKDQVLKDAIEAFG